MFLKFQFDFNMCSLIVGDGTRHTLEIEILRTMQKNVVVEYHSKQCFGIKKGIRLIKFGDASIVLIVTVSQDKLDELEKQGTK